MELYHCNRLIAEIFGFFSDDGLLGLNLALGIGVGVWLVLFILQGFGLYRMAKNGERKAGCNYEHRNRTPPAEALKKSLQK